AWLPTPRRPAYTAPAELRHLARAVLVERLHQILGDLHGVAALDLMALQHEGDLAVLEERDRGRRRRVADDVLAGARRRLDLLPGEDGRHVLGPGLVLERPGHGGTHAPGRAATHRVDHDHRGAVLRLLHEGVHLLGRAQLLDPEAGQLPAHRRDHEFRIGHSATSFDDATRPALWRVALRFRIPGPRGADPGGGPNAVGCASRAWRRRRADRLCTPRARPVHPSTSCLNTTPRAASSLMMKSKHASSRPTISGGCTPGSRNIP